MRTVGTNRDVVDAFMASCATGQDSGPWRSKSGNIYWESDTTGPVGTTRTLFSYGKHFPLAVHNRQLTGSAVLLNGDHCSSTTHQHRGLVQRGVPASVLDEATTSFAALSDAVTHLEPTYNCFPRMTVVVALSRGRLHLLDYIESQVSYTQPVYLDGWTYIHQRGWRDGYWHRPASLLFSYADKSGRLHWLLCSMDEGSYFVSLLPRSAKSIGEAFASLKPEAVQRWEASTGKTALRQGEWFFLPADSDAAPYRHEWKLLSSSFPGKRLYKNMQPRFALPSNGTAHVATRGCQYGDMLLVSGAINHPDHRRLRLSFAKRPRYYLALRNTAIRSWSVNGVD